MPMNRPLEVKEKKISNKIFTLTSLCNQKRQKINCFKISLKTDAYRHFWEPLLIKSCTQTLKKSRW